MNILKKLIICCILLIGMNTFGYTAKDTNKTQIICASCHGKTGNTMTPSYPKLAGQNEKYFIKQMLAFKKTQRDNLIMQNIASNLTEADLRDLAAYYAKQSPQIGIARRVLVKPGQRLYRAGDKDRYLPACMTCHGPAGEGNSLAGIPMLAGQHSAYTKAQLFAYRTNTRKTDPNQIMQDIANHLTDDDIAALASYIEGLHRIH
ncbi:MAG: cytochrome c4 [Gammaproteobacteria bacterium]|jgi:cytochrome c553|nr:cytochrome c4 [Gammaproteobacteria bacterium]